MKFMCSLRNLFFVIALIMLLYGVITEGMVVEDRLATESQRTYSLGEEVLDPVPPTVPSSFFFWSAGLSGAAGILTLLATALVRRYNSQKAVDRIMEASFPLPSPMDRWRVK